MTMLKNYTFSLLLMLFAYQISFAGPPNSVPNSYIFQMASGTSYGAATNTLNINFGGLSIYGPTSTNAYLVYQNPNDPNVVQLIGDDDVDDVLITTQIDWPDPILSADYNYYLNPSNIVTGQDWRNHEIIESNPCHDNFYQMGHISENEVDLAVFDTGINDNGDPLIDSYINTGDYDSWGHNYIDEGANSPQDEHGHGTSINSIALRNFDETNALGNLDVLNYKTHNDEGDGDLWSMMLAIDQAIEDEVNVINMSYSYYADYNYRFIENLPISNLLNNAKERGILCVAAAGNDKTNLDSPDEKSYYPAAFTHDNILTVGAMKCSGQRAWFSNYGAKSVDIFANGWRVEALDLSGNWVRTKGTSPAAALVSAAALQLGTHQDEFDYQKVKCALMTGAVETGPLSENCVSQGYVNVNNALEYLGNCQQNHGRVAEIDDKSVSHNFDGDKIHLNIETSSLQNVSVAVYNTMGQEVANYPAEMIDGSKRISLEIPTEGPQAIYFARIFMDNRMKTIKFFKYDMR